MISISLVQSVNMKLNMNSPEQSFSVIIAGGEMNRKMK